MNENRDVNSQSSVNESVAALAQIENLITKALPMAAQFQPDHRSFRAKRLSREPAGIASLTAKITDDGIIRLLVELARVPRNVRIFPVNLFRDLAALGEKTRILAPEENTGDDATTSLSVEIGIQATLMSMTRSSVLLAELKNLDQIANSIQSQIPLSPGQADLLRIYKDVSDVLQPIFPLAGAFPAQGGDLMEWAEETLEFLSGSLSIALSSSFSATEGLALSLLAGVALNSGKTVGKVIVPSIAGKGVVEIAKKFPGYTVVPVSSLSLGASAYEMGNEMRSMLVALASHGVAALFTGSYDQLQSVFHGGQGGISDPLTPVVRRAPDASLEILCPYAVQIAAAAIGGVPLSVQEQMVAGVVKGLQELPKTEQIRILPAVASRVVRAWDQGKKSTIVPGSFAKRVSNLTETLAGLNQKPRAQRGPLTQERFLAVLTDPQVLDYLKENILAQDDALEQLFRRLRTEVLTRPSHQPLRYCVQGTPGTGKSESARLLAERLGIPYVNIDAASIPDYYSAAAQLLGSGRGIVGSYQSGRLEQAAKHHTGALIEVSDLDHAHERVRSGLADLFLQVLETGEAQSAAGALFSCANLIFAFTMNLPEGLDERVRKGIGFTDQQSKEALTSRVIHEIKQMLSGAFVSRVGTPILFEPLDGPRVATILERAVHSAVLAAITRMGTRSCSVKLQKGLGTELLGKLNSKLLSFGARAILEHGRALAAEAVLNFKEKLENANESPLTVTLQQDGRLKISMSGD